jgi:hypothetical protein
VGQGRSPLTRHCYLPTKLQIPDKIASPYAQGVSDDFKRPQGHALLAVLQPVEMRSVQAR